VTYQSKLGYRFHRRVYTFRAMVDEYGWNVERTHKLHEGRIRCDCLKLWDINVTGTGRNILRITRGRGHFVVLIGKNYRRLGWSRNRNRKWGVGE